MQVKHVKRIAQHLRKHHFTHGSGPLIRGPDCISIMLDLTWESNTYILTVDAHSKWIDVHIVNSTSVETTIMKLRSVFATHRLPEQIVSNNGTGFASEEFKKFTEQNGIKHNYFYITHHPSSYGMACLSKESVNCKEQSKTKLHSFSSNIVLLLRLQHAGLSPVKLLVGRRL